MTVPIPDAATSSSTTDYFKSLRIYNVHNHNYKLIHFFIQIVVVLFRDEHAYTTANQNISRVAMDNTDNKPLILVMK